MNKNVETGVQRLYYVAWLAWAGLIVVTLVTERGPGFLLGVLIFAVSAGLAPYLVMRTIRWVYRGFYPAKPADHSVKGST